MDGVIFLQTFILVRDEVQSVLLTPCKPWFLQVEYLVLGNWVKFGKISIFVTCPYYFLFTCHFKYLLIAIHCDQNVQSFLRIFAYENSENISNVVLCLSWQHDFSRVWCASAFCDRFYLCLCFGCITSSSLGVTGKCTFCSTSFFKTWALSRIQCFKLADGCNCCWIDLASSRTKIATYKWFR